MQRVIILGIALVSACAATTQVPKAAAPQPVADIPMDDEARCREAGELRSQGFQLLSELKLAAARKVYVASLALDPGNKGALYQLDVIDALAEDRQIGTSAANNNMYGGVNRSPCEKYATSQLPSLRAKQTQTVQKPVVTQQGQVVTFAKGTVKPSELSSKEDIEVAFKSAMKQMQSCYANAVAKNPTLRGDMTVQLAVDPSGKVVDVKLSGNTLYETAVEQCVATLSGKVHFPKRKSKHDMNVLYPLTFGPESEALAGVDDTATKGRAGR
jgi:hypothetical protein